MASGKLIVAMGMALALVPIVSAQSDTECGNETSSLIAGKPNVLILGDSISMAVPYTPGGYGVNIQQLLGAKGINVQHAGGWYGGGQDSYSVKGVLCTDHAKLGNWLNYTGTFDVIHMNFGLHDLVNCTGTPECAEHVDLPTYGSNLATIFSRLSPRGKSVIWATTTPVPNVTTSLGRSWQGSIDYNAQALKSLKAVAPGGALIVDDLWATIVKACGFGYKSCPLQLPANVHFTPAGQAALGAQAAASILTVLKGQGWDL